MLTAVPDSYWGYDYLLHREDGQTVGRVKINWGWGESGTVTAGDTFLEIEREGRTRPWFVRSQGQVVASIVKPSAFSRSFEIQWNQLQFRLEPRTWSSSFELFCGTQCFGSLDRYGLFSRKMNVNLSDTVPLALQAIAVWVVLLMWRRAARSS